MTATYALKDRIINIDWDYVDNIDEEKPLLDKLAKIDELMAKMAFDQAKIHCQQAIEEYPQDLRFRRKYFELGKLAPGDKSFHQQVFNIFKMANKRDCSSEQLHFIADILSEYCKLSEKRPALNEAICIILSEHFMRMRELDHSQLLVKRLLNMKSRHTKIPGILLSMVNLLEKASHRKESQYYHKQLNRHYADSEEALQLTRHS